MNKLTGFVALGGAALVATLVPIASAQAATTARSAAITRLETVGGVQVVYNAEAAQVTPSAGVAITACEGAAVPSQTQVWAECWLNNLDTGERYSGPGFHGQLAGGQTAAELITSGSRLQLCMLVDIQVGTTVHYGPVRCASVA